MKCILFSAILKRWNIRRTPVQISFWKGISKGVLIIFWDSRKVKCSKWMKCFFSAISEKVRYKGNPYPICVWKGVQIIFWDSRKVKILKMNEMLFVFNHSEKVKYKGNPCPNFLLTGGPDNILGFKKGKSSQNEWNAFCFQPFWKGEPLSKFSFERGSRW